MRSRLLFAISSLIVIGLFFSMRSLVQHNADDAGDAGNPWPPVASAPTQPTQRMPSAETVPPPVSADGSRVETPSPGCSEITFRHKPLPGHRTRNECAQHRNLIVLGNADELVGIAWKSLCLRIDGTPTAFERTANGIAFSPVAGPNSKVTVRYCRNKATCPADCKIPRDTFLDSIGATLEREKPLVRTVAQWDPADSENEPDPTETIETELRDALGPNHEHATGMKLFKEWAAIARTSGCGEVIAERGE